MWTIKGRDRFVVPLPWFGIVFKFPIIHLWSATKVLWRCIKSGDRKYLRTNWYYPVEMPWGFKGLLFKGIVENWREFAFYREARNSFLQPTYFSIGLFSIQQYGKPCRIQYVDLWSQLLDLTNGAVWGDVHHFSNPRNFCFDGQRLRMLDYGSQASRKVVVEHGERIVRDFNPAYSWEEVKKELQQQEEIVAKEQLG